jgi:glycosyltransferase involved in cell wall biosynthesis
MVGDGGTMAQVRGLIGGAEYSRWVIFTGLVQQSETVKYLAACDILVSPHVANADGSRFFGSPTKLFEYMAMGKGIIASDLDQIGEVLGDGIRIWREQTRNPIAPSVLVRPGNVDDLVRAIRTLVEDPALRNQLGANARAELMRKYTWRHHVDHIVSSIGTQRTTHALLENEGSLLIS